MRHFDFEMICQSFTTKINFQILTVDLLIFFRRLLEQTIAPKIMTWLKAWYAMLVKNLQPYLVLGVA